MLTILQKHFLLTVGAGAIHFDLFASRPTGSCLLSTKAKVKDLKEGSTSTITVLEILTHVKADNYPPRWRGSGGRGYQGKPMCLRVIFLSQKSFHRGWLRPYFGDKLLEARSTFLSTINSCVCTNFEFLAEKDSSFFSL